MKLTDRQLAIIYGALLGDAYIAKLDYGYATYYRFEVEHSVEDSEYVYWLYDELKDIFNVGPRLRERHSNLDGRGIKSKSLSLYSKMDDFFRELREEIYVDNRKAITAGWLEKLTPLSLAVWYMDDGSYHINRNTVEISTYSFTLEEHHLIRDYLRDVYDINISIARRGKGKRKCYYVYFPREEAIKLLKIVSPYILPCMQRKLPLGWDKAHSLPPHFHLRINRKADKEINKRLIIQNLVSFYEQIGRPEKFPVVLYNYTPGTYSFKAINAVFGSWEKALTEAGLPSQFM